MKLLSAIAQGFGAAILLCCVGIFFPFFAPIVALGFIPTWIFFAILGYCIDRKDKT